MRQIPWPGESGRNTLFLKSLFIQNMSALSFWFSKWVGRGATAEVNTVHSYWNSLLACGFPRPPNSIDCRAGDVATNVREFFQWLPTWFHWIREMEPVYICWCTLEINLGIHLKNELKARCTKRRYYVFSPVFVSLARQGGVSKEICK